MSEPVQPPLLTLERLSIEVQRLREVQQIQVAALETLDRKVERILMKLEHRDG